MLRVLIGVAALAVSVGVADGKTVAAVLLVDENQRAVTERLGVSAFLPFLEEGPYAEIKVLTERDNGYMRLPEVVRELAVRHGLIDLFVLAHGRTLPMEPWLTAIPPRARKLRLVYTSGCESAAGELPVWERLGAQTVVAHVGLNNPITAFPFVLSEWIAGRPIGPAVAAGYTESSRVLRLGISLVDGAGETLLPGGFSAESLVTGAQPVLSGDPSLTIASGLSGFVPNRPKALEYDRSEGGALGLLLRSAAGRFVADRAECLEAVEALGLPYPFTELGTSFSSVSIEKRGGWEDSGEVYDGELVVQLTHEVELPLEDFVLSVGPTVTIQVGPLDPARRLIRLEVTGLWVKRGALRFRVTSLTVRPVADDAGYQVTVGGGVWGILPFWVSEPIGGSPPKPVTGPGPILRDQDGALGRLATASDPR